MAVDADTTAELNSTVAGDGQEYDDVAPSGLDVVAPSDGPRAPSGRATLLATVVGTVVTAVLAIIGVPLARDAWVAQTEAGSDDEFVAAARQGALNLTTIDYRRADDDVRRVLDSSTGRFKDDFAARSVDFVRALREVKSVSAGTVVDAGLETRDGDSAAALVAIKVSTTIDGVADEGVRHWRMRIGLEREGNAIKVSDVEFVP